MGTHGWGWNLGALHSRTANPRGARFRARTLRRPPLRTSTLTAPRRATQPQHVRSEPWEAPAPMREPKVSADKIRMVLRMRDEGAELAQIAAALGPMAEE